MRYSVPIPRYSPVSNVGVYGESGSSLLIESTNSIMYIVYFLRRLVGVGGTVNSLYLPTTRCSVPTIWWDSELSLPSNDTFLCPDDLPYSAWPCEHVHWCHPAYPCHTASLHICSWLSPQRSSACPCHAASLHIHSWLSPQRLYSPLEVSTGPAHALAPHINYV